MNTRSIILAQEHSPRPVLRAAFWVEQIDSFSQFQALRAEWDALHAKDPESGIFLSWLWYETSFSLNPGRWRVFVVRDAGASGQVRCILPTKYRVHWSTTKSTFQTEVEAAGRLNWGEYAGFVCDPAFESEALIALADQIAQMPWVRFSLRYESSERRAEIFTSAFDSATFAVRWKPYMINKGTTNNLVCPRLHLPDSFEDWLSGQVSTNTRQKIRRFWRAYIDSGRYRMSLITPKTLGRDINILLSYWVAKWGPTKGAERAAAIAEDYRKMLVDADRIGALYLSVLWDNDRPVAAMGGVIDHAALKLHFILSGRDEADESPAIGLLLHAVNIQKAIESGLRVYDFGHGDEPYKFRYGSVEERVKYFEISRSSSDADTLDSLSHPEAFRRLGDFIRAGKSSDALAACEALARS